MNHNEFKSLAAHFAELQAEAGEYFHINLDGRRFSLGLRRGDWGVVIDSLSGGLDEFGPGWTVLNEYGCPTTRHATPLAALVAELRDEAAEHESRARLFAELLKALNQ